MDDLESVSLSGGCDEGTRQMLVLEYSELHQGFVKESQSRKVDREGKAHERRDDFMKG